nr:hypothetical protein [Verrucomicrobiota bacterium]
MMAEEQTLIASTPPASAAIAQTRECPDAAAGVPAAKPAGATEGRDFEMGEGVTRGIHTLPYEREAGDPVYRPLRIFSLDPSVSRLEGAEALVNVPYEPLE